LLRSPRERPRSRRAANHLDEIASSHVALERGSGLLCQMQAKQYHAPSRQYEVSERVGGKLPSVISGLGMPALGHSRPSHFVPVLNNVRYASDSDHSRYESELTLWAISGHCALRLKRGYSTTSSAVASSVCGNVRPNVLAVFRFKTRSNFVGCSTGKSDGFEPCSILCTYVALRRKRSGMLAP
jgi:hypothetical protein